MAGEKAVFITCPEAGMTNVTFTSNPSTLLAKLEARCPLPVELVAEVEASRGAVAAVQRRLNGARAHHQWFEGVVDSDEAHRLVEEGERDARAPSGAEVTAWRYRVRTFIEDVESLDDDEDAREAWRKADAALGSMVPRLVVDSHRELADALRRELIDAGKRRAERAADADDA